MVPLHISGWRQEVECRIHKGSQIIPILRQINPIPCTDIYLRPILILSSYLRLGLPKVLFPVGLLVKISKASLKLREECRLKVFENRILRQIFGPKRNANREWRRLHNDKLHSLYRSPNMVSVITSRRLLWVSHVTRMEVVRTVLLNPCL